ncbi:MAG: ABC transporter permease subunit [Patescibacteria group bacterium]
MPSKLTQLKAIIQKELRVYFNSPIAYIFLVAFLGFTFWLFFRNFFLVGQADVQYMFDVLPWIYLLLIPAMTMRLWAEEKRGGTIENLLTSSAPLSISVLAKFIASLIFLLITLAATLPLPLIVSSLGPLDWGATLAAYLGAILLGSSYIALGLLLSSITNNQIVAYIISSLACFALFIIAQPLVTISLPAFIIPVVDFISFGSHYDSIVRGVVDTRDLIYYLSFIGLMLYLNAYVLFAKK